LVLFFKKEHSFERGYDMIHVLSALAVRLLLIIAVLVPLERMFAARAQKILRAGFFTDIAYYFFANLLPNMLLAVPLSALAWLLHIAVPSPFYAFMAGLPLPLRLALALVAGEIGFYWGHRWMHEIPMLWRFHAIHHAAEDMDWLVNTRAHPVDLFLARLTGLIPIYVLGLAQPMANQADIVPLLVALIGSFWGFFVHANLSWRFGWLENVIATPAFHHWHHTNDGPDVIDKNFASMLPWIDRLFGTFHVPKRQFPRSYGIAAPMPKHFWGQLAFPWSSQALPQTRPQD
jgi:sterol desaturase/sphingolipid hydroxylase (fatty acid hydroxylase superfamily)